MAAGLSAVVPGLGQALNREFRLARVFAAPALLLVAIVWLLLQLRSPAQLAATFVSPPFLTFLLILNGAVLLWRLASVGQAFLDRRHAHAPGRRSWLGLALLMAFVAIPHGIGNLVGTAAMSTFDRVFEEGDVAGSTFTPGPGTTERLNVMLVGLDAAPGRDAVLTDTIMVVSLDPIGKTVTMVSIPRDMVNVPLGDGDTFAPKINSLYGWAERHPDDFPSGGLAALQRAIGALLGIEIHYRAVADLAGFVQMVDAVGGIDVDVKRPLDDPKYDGFGGDGRGWSIEAGRHHLNGYDALAYARIRRTLGETDFTRAERQQQVLVAIRNAAVRGDSLLFRLPALLDAVGDTVRTNLPRHLLPALAAIASEVDGGRTVRIVIRHPLVHPASTQYGAVQVPDLAAIRSVAAAAFTTPGVAPQPWPTPLPTPTPRAPSSSAAPSGGPAAP